MGLFDGGAKKQAIENEVMQILSQQPILNEIMHSIQNNMKDNSWMLQCQGYYDSRQRSIIIEPDAFIINWKEKENVEDEKGNIQEIYKKKASIGLAYTDLGYMPLHSYKSKEGKELVSAERVAFLWASIIKERMKVHFHDCNFSDVWQDGKKAFFTYYVPKQEFKSWF